MWRLIGLFDKYCKEHPEYAPQLENEISEIKKDYYMSYPLFPFCHKQPSDLPEYHQALEWKKEMQKKRKGKIKQKEKKK
jgi:hypothetical protein